MIAFVKATTGGTSSTVSSIATSNFSGSTASGNSILVFVGDNQNAATVTSVTDTQGNSYSQFGTTSGSSGIGTLELWIAHNITGGSAFNITVNFPSQPNTSIIAAEVSGVNKLDQIAYGGSGNAGPTGTTVSPDELVMGAFVTSANGAFTVGAGYSNFVNTNLGNTNVAIESKVVSTTGTQTATMVQGFSNVGMVVTFRQENIPLSVSDSTTISESINVFVSGVKPVENVTITENVNVSLQIPNQSFTENVTITENVAAQVYFPINKSDSVTITESISLSQSFQPVVKTFLYKVYDSTGTTLIKTWTDVKTEPQFAQDVNSGGSQLVLELARPADNYGEGVDIDFGLQVKILVVDTEAPTGAVVFIGFIADYKPAFGDNEMLTVTLLGYGNELDNYMLDDNTTTTFAYNSTDPGAILRDVIDKYRTQGGTLNYTTSTIELTGTIVSYTFNTNSIKDCIDKCLELAPLGWYWYIDQATNLIHFHPKATSSAYNFTLSKDIKSAEAEKRSEEIVNIVYFTGGGSPALYNKYTNPASIALYGRRMLSYVDQRVTLAATATTISTGILNTFGLPAIRLNLEILDNNTFSDGFNIESIHVGDVFGLRNISGGVGNYIDITMVLFQVLRLEYSPSIARVTSSTILPDVNKRIADINRNLTDSITVNDPANPSRFTILNLTESITITENIGIVIV